MPGNSRFVDEKEILTKTPKFDEFNRVITASRNELVHLI